VRKGKVLTHSLFTHGERGDIMEIYSIEDLKSYPNIEDDEIKSCKDIIKYENEVFGEDNIVGFTREIYSSDENPSFIQVYIDEVEFLEGG
jgi:hypothetical protein